MSLVATYSHPFRPKCRSPSSGSSRSSSPGTSLPLALCLELPKAQEPTEPTEVGRKREGVARLSTAGTPPCAGLRNRTEALTGAAPANPSSRTYRRKTLTCKIKKNCFSCTATGEWDLGKGSERSRCHATEGPGAQGTLPLAVPEAVPGGMRHLRGYTT